MPEIIFENDVSTTEPQSSEKSRSSPVFLIIGALAFVISFFVLPTFGTLLSSKKEVTSVPVVGLVMALFYVVALLLGKVAAFTIGFSMYFAAFVSAIIEKSYWSAFVAIDLTGACALWLALPFICHSAISTFG